MHFLSLLLASLEVFALGEALGLKLEVLSQIMKSSLGNN